VRLETPSQAIEFLAVLHGVFSTLLLIITILRIDWRVCRMKSQGQIVTLCGNPQYFDAFMSAQRDLALAGNIVLTNAFLHPSDNAGLASSTDNSASAATRIMLADMCRQQIEMSDYVFVVNVDGDIDETTRVEILYALETGKRVQYLEPPVDHKTEAVFNKATLSGVRARIRKAKAKATHNGYINWYGSMDVCDEMCRIVSDAAQYLTDGKYLLAFSIATLIVTSATRLAETADDSGGGVTMAIHAAHQLIEEISLVVEKGTPQAEAVFVQGLKDAESKVFYGWSDTSYLILQPIARLTTKENMAKLDATLIALAERSSDRKDSDYARDQSPVRYTAIASVYGAESADAFAEEHLKSEEVRRLHFERMMAIRNYTRAEQLCQELVEKYPGDNYWGIAWRTRLYSVYQASGDRQKLKHFLYDSLLVAKQADYYDPLKALLLQEGTWETEYPLLLRQIESSLEAYSYMGILDQEQEWSLLIKALRKEPKNIFTFAEHLALHEPQETYALCTASILALAKNSTDRRGYQQVRSDLRQLYRLGGQQEALSLAETLLRNYPKRPAFKEELNKALEQMSHTKRK